MYSLNLTKYKETVDFVTFTKKSFIGNFIFVCNGWNNLSLLIYFQYHYYLIYRVDDVNIMILISCFYNVIIQFKCFSYVTLLVGQP